MNLIKLIFEDLKCNSGKNPISILLSFFYGQSFRLILNYRIGNYCYRKKFLLRGLFITLLRKRQLQKYACDISYQSKIGRRIKFLHPLGIVIGTNVSIEDDVMIWQHVTLGSITKGATKTYPIIKSNVKLYSGCQVLGPVTVNRFSIVGASSLVLKDVPECATVAGIPARTIQK